MDRVPATWRSCEAMVSASVTACPAPMASSNTCADADDAGLPEAVGDASLFGSIHATKPIAAKMSFPMSCRGSACVSIGDVHGWPRPQAYTDALAMLYAAREAERAVPTMPPAPDKPKDIKG